MWNSVFQEWHDPCTQIQSSFDYLYKDCIRLDPSTSIIDEEGFMKFPPVAEELLAVNGSWERESNFP